MMPEALTADLGLRLTALSPLIAKAAVQPGMGKCPTLTLILRDRFAMELSSIGYSTDYFFSILSPCCGGVVAYSEKHASAFLTPTVFCWTCSSVRKRTGALRNVTAHLLAPKRERLISLALAAYYPFPNLLQGEVAVQEYSLLLTQLHEFLATDAEAYLEEGARP